MGKECQICHSWIAELNNKGEHYAKTELDKNNDFLFTDQISLVVLEKVHNHEENHLRHEIFSPSFSTWSPEDTRADTDFSLNFETSRKALVWLFWNKCNLRMRNKNYAHLSWSQFTSLHGCGRPRDTLFSNITVSKHFLTAKEACN